MGIFSIIMLVIQILQALPEVIRIVRQIIDLIRGLPEGERAVATQRLRNVLLRVRQKKAVSDSDQTELESLLSDLQAQAA